MQRILIVLGIVLLSCSFCKKNDDNPPVIVEPPVITDPDTTYTFDKFSMGADLSYVNQILDKGGLYRDSGLVRDPYRIFKEHGANTIRLRLWHNPTWTKTVYTPAGSKMYNDLADVEKAIKKSKDLGMAVNLDIHYSDTWADPSQQKPPAAWSAIKDTATLRDSVYNYTYKVLNYLNSKNLMPEMVQIGNETNSGILSTNIPAGFPDVNVNNSKWKEQGVVLNAGIRAVRAVAALSSIKPKVILHIADPKNVEWWFDNIKLLGKVTDFDVVGFSYYPLWHTAVTFDNLGPKIATFKSKYGKKVMILETAYPWTTSTADSYNNQFGSQAPLANYPYTIDGQYNFMVSLTQKVIGAGGSGVMYWEPAWITSQLKDLWGTGSSWENVTFFSFTGNTQKGIDFMNYTYTFPGN